MDNCRHMDGSVRHLNNKIIYCKFCKRITMLHFHEPPEDRARWHPWHNKAQYINLATGEIYSK